MKSARDLEMLMKIKSILLVREGVLQGQRGEESSSNKANSSRYGYSSRLNVRFFPFRELTPFTALLK